MPSNFDDWVFVGSDSELESSDCEGMRKADLGGNCDSVADDDVVGKLPADPFGMDIRSTITIARWFQNLGVASDSNCGSLEFDEDGKKFDDHRELLAGLDWVWNGSVRVKGELGGVKFGGMSIPCDGFDGCGIETGVLNLKEFMSLGSFGNLVPGEVVQELRDCGKTCLGGGEGGQPHDAMFFALGYLSVQDLLSIEMVCKSLRDGVRSDPLLWRSIHIEQPLSEKITDDALQKLVSRARGNLQCLNLVACIRITDEGLKRVLETNPRLTKLSVPGCIRLSIEGILTNLRAFKSVGSPGIKHLRIGGICRVTDKQFEQLQGLLNVDKLMQLSVCRPLIYRGGKSYVSCDDDRAIDIEVCPRCQQLRLVYDCPAESCQGKHQAAPLCRACTLCIERCINCGHCIKDRDYEETFCLDLLCLDCWKQLFDCEDRPGEKGASKCTIFHRETRYQFCFYG